MIKIFLEPEEIISCLDDNGWCIEVQDRGNTEETVDPMYQQDSWWLPFGIDMVSLRNIKEKIKENHEESENELLDFKNHEDEAPLAIIAKKIKTEKEIQILPLWKNDEKLWVNIVDYRGWDILHALWNIEKPMEDIIKLKKASEKSA